MTRERKLEFELEAVDAVWKAGALAAALVSLALAPEALGAQNLLQNPSFHSDTASWDLLVGTQLLWTDVVEASACSGSGSALVISDGDNEGQTAGIGQCVTLHGEPTLYASVQHRGYGQFYFRLFFYTAVNCGTGILDTTLATEAQDPDAWSLLTQVTSVPPNANGVYLSLVAADAEPHGLSVDEVSLTAGFPIFLDGFDGNDDGEVAPCRWSP